MKLTEIYRVTNPMSPHYDGDDDPSDDVLALSSWTVTLEKGSTRHHPHKLHIIQTIETTEFDDAADVGIKALDEIAEKYELIFLNDKQTKNTLESWYELRYMINMRKFEDELDVLMRKYAEKLYYNKRRG